MKKHISIIASLLALWACSTPVAPEFKVIPLPREVNMAEGVFKAAGAPVEIDERLDEASVRAVGRFTSALETASGKKMREGKGGFRFVLNPELGDEEYTLDIDKKGVLVEASALNGFVYATETLKQMLPAGIYSGERSEADWVLPCVSISDSPRFAYRGMHLDACRHFWSIEETKRYLDVMTAYKLNRFHWHLTEDQGWRIEIKAYPRLTEVGAWRSGTMVGKERGTSDGIRYGGFYTQDELREIVAYAADRGITVIPEIDLPGHMLAALASYPSLGCTGGPYEVRTEWGIATEILCAGNEEVFTFLENVFSELLEIFPSKYIHIGGDECFGSRKVKNQPIPWDSCPKCARRMKELGIKKGPEARHLLQNYVTARVQKILEDKGRKIIGWDEILEGELAPGATVMSWRGTEGGIKAAAKGLDVIMTPNTYMYFDYYQSGHTELEPLCIGGNLPLDKVYSYEPLDGIPAGAEGRITGVQANLWTEYISTTEHLEYMLLPRLCALSEIQWCQSGAKDNGRFLSYLEHSLEIADALKMNYSLDHKGLFGLERVQASPDGPTSQ